MEFLVGIYGVMLVFIRLISVWIMFRWILEKLWDRLLIFSIIISCVRLLFSGLLMFVVWDSISECCRFFRFFVEIWVCVSRLKLVLML